MCVRMRVCERMPVCMHLSVCECMPVCVYLCGRAYMLKNSQFSLSFRSAPDIDLRFLGLHSKPLYPLNHHPNYLAS